MSEISLHLAESGCFLIFCSLDKMAAMRSLVPANLSKFAGQACMHVFLNNFLILGDIETAKTMLNHCLEKHDRFSEGHLLMAQVLLYCSMFFAYFFQEDASISCRKELTKREIFFFRFI